MINGKTSVIIPCVPLDLCKLPTMIDSLRRQTVLPKEVIVALSQVEPQDIAELEKYCVEYPFPVKLCGTLEKMFAGQNRNRGAALAAHEIFVFCDADDVCHPQKIEITEYVFSAYGPKLFLHGFTRNIPTVDFYDIKKIPLVFSDRLFANTFGNPPKRGNSKFIFTDRPAENRWIEGSHPHHGYASVARDVFDRIKYNDLRRGEDTEFCLDVLWKFKSAVFADFPLVNYDYYKVGGAKKYDKPNLNI